MIRDSAHQALEDLREVIGVLRDAAPTADDAARAARSRPWPTCPSWSRSPARPGMRVRLDRQVDAVDAVPDGVGRNAYRIVQEGLTNARKHAPGAAVTVDRRGHARATA